VRDQLVYFARLHGLTAVDAGAAADRWIERLGLSERARDRAETLSLGNQQRVQLAVALVTSRRCSCSTSRSPASTRSAST
jgi:ABC-2 type transport system ATP-binding protein